MTYSSSKLNLVKSGLNGGPSLWDYTHTDAHGTVEGAGYFSDAKQRGMKANDKVIVCNTGDGSTTIHTVTGLSGNAATINTATLA